MGIESDQVVYEYLSRVGDVAQQRQLPSATRMRLVSELRNEIDRRRAKAVVDSPAAVRRIVERLGSPDEVVRAAGGPADGTPQAPPAQVPVQRAGEPEESDGGDGGRTNLTNLTKGSKLPKGLRRVVPRPRPDQAPTDVPSPPHPGSDGFGGGPAQPDWWRVDSRPGAFGAGAGVPGFTSGLGDSVPGFVGGVEIPEMLKLPPSHEDPEPAEETAEARPAPVLEKKPGRLGRVGRLVRLGKPAAPAVPPPVAVEVPVARRRLRIPGGGAGGWTNPFLLLAAGLLVAGAVLGNWIALVVGWAIAYASRRLTDAETKWAVVILPGLSLTAGAVWLWGRTAGRWGEPIAEGHMSDAMAQTWPWVVRGAAVTSALFLVWRSQRRR